MLENTLPKVKAAIGLALCLLVCTHVPAANAATEPKLVPTISAWNIQLVGHNALFNRGMNAALAIYDHYVYIGNRTDSSSLCVGATGEPSGDQCPHPHPGILVVDVKDPANPTIVGEIGKPYAGNVGITTRELRVWPDKKLLIVMDFRCSTLLHACQSGNDKQFPFDIAFFDLSDPVKPRFVARYVPTSQKGEAVKPHEMFLWVDPSDRQRALLYLSTPTISKDPSVPNLIVTDISGVSEGHPVTEIAEGNWNSQYPGTDQPDYPLTSGAHRACGPYDCNLFVHSMGISPDGARAYLSMEAGQFLILNTAALAKGPSPRRVLSLNSDLITQPVNRPVWGQTPADPRAVPANCKKACANGHSAIKVPGRPLVFMTDEVYGTYTEPSAGCPWGWAHLIDITDQAHPKIVGEFETPQDSSTFCDSSNNDKLTEQFTSYSSHNPTVLQSLAIVAWHSAGLQVIDISNGSHPTSAGVFSPSALERVATEDPALGRGPNKVIMWSYPIIKDGLIYVVDVRNGLYILRYTGPHADEISAVKFLEGNSNVGDAVRLEHP
jgi:LVIVD repeat